eukprot:CAMPEP_0195519362 /NCGR_PEP_ID=MMETSP0794_2-20130614/14604_1 /TAXON_ID=515487 /ORGANISM="Stephanopyxis turris, Strain CCMP 815" /LENGTH=259 /DNA_ID=CAMNT_0040648501 /DNA_START=36 /DNA_END=812 /DNA_ORIENTATION=+
MDEEADAWGYVDDGEYDDDYGGAGYSQSSRTAQVKEEGPTTEDFLSDAVRNLLETEELGEEGLAMLAEQREVLGNIKRNVDRMDASLNEADRVITEMENPWALKGTHITKHSGNRSAVTDDFMGGGGGSFNMEGAVLKRGRTLKAWHPRYFRQNGNVIEYMPKKGAAKFKVIELKGAKLVRLDYGEVDSNGVEVDKDNCFEIFRAGRDTGDTIHVEASSDFRTWVSCIERQIRREAAIARGVDVDAGPKKAHRGGVGFG